MFLVNATNKSFFDVQYTYLQRIIQQNAKIWYFSLQKALALMPQMQNKH